MTALAQASRCTRAAIAIAFLGVALLPGVATAQRVNAPPGNSGVQEYVETIPDGSGKRSTNPAGNVLADGPSPPTGIVRDATRRELARRGAGRAAALAEVTAPPSSRGAAAGQGDSPLAGAVRAADGGGPGGMGFFLPLFMAATLIASALYAWVKRREQ